MFAKAQLVAFVLCAASLAQGGPIEAGSPIPFPTGTCSLTNTITQTVPHDYTANPTYTPPVYGPDCSVVLTVTERLPPPSISTGVPYPTGTCSLTSTITQTVPFDHTANPTYTPPVYGPDCSVVLTVTERLPPPSVSTGVPYYPTGTCSLTSTITQTVPFDYTANPTYTPPVYGPDCSVVLTVTERLPAPTSTAYPTGTCSITNTITQTVAHDHTANPTYTPPVYGPDCSVVLTVTERLPAPTA